MFPQILEDYFKKPVKYCKSLPTQHTDFPTLKPKTFFLFSVNHFFWITSFLQQDEFSWVKCLLRNLIRQKEWLKRRSGWLFLFSLSSSHTHTILPHCPVWSAPPLLVAPGQCATDPVESERGTGNIRQLKLEWINKYDKYNSTVISFFILITFFQQTKTH